MKERVISLALLAAVSIGIAPAFSQVGEDAAGVASNDNIIADGMIQEHKCRRIIKKCAHKARRVVKAPVQKVVRIETIKTIEKPVVVEQPQPQPEQKVEKVEQVIQQPAVVESQQPIIIDRFERRHRSLIHLGLFPFSFFRK